MVILLHILQLISENKYSLFVRIEGFCCFICVQYLHIFNILNVQISKISDQDSPAGSRTFIASPKVSWHIGSILSIIFAIITDSQIAAVAAKIHTVLNFSRDKYKIEKLRATVNDQLLKRKRKYIQNNNA